MVRDDFRLAVDVGNTTVKLGVFRGGDLVARHVCREDVSATVESLMGTYPISRAIMGAVGGREEEVRQLLEGRVPVQVLSCASKFPFRIAYCTPDTLGVDRLAAVAGASFAYPGRAALVVDAGTAITYDFLDAEGVYRGGAISPGLSLRFAALHRYTARLPLVGGEGDVPIIGYDTTTCIRSGVVRGVLGEVAHFAREYGKGQEGVLVILTGGDADFLHKNLFYCNFVRSNLVLEGLNGLLDYNA